MSETNRKTAVVTGGSAGIGRAICENLLDGGWEVVSLARRKSDIQHPRMHSMEVDLSDRAATGAPRTACTSVGAAGATTWRVTVTV